MDKYQKEETNPSKEKVISENLLEKVLADAKPITTSSLGAKYDLYNRPTELSSGGYIDYAGDDPSN